MYKVFSKNTATGCILTDKTVIITSELTKLYVQRFHHQYHVCVQTVEKAKMNDQ